MMPKSEAHYPDSPIFRTAEQIFTISRYISEYMTDELAVLRSDGQEDPVIYFGGDIVQQSVSLAPEILKAEAEAVPEQKRKYAASITRLVNRIYRSCERLEGANSNGKDFLPLLRKEIKKFRKLQRNWMLTF